MTELPTPIETKILLIACVLVALDIITGFTAAWLNNKLSSKVARQGFGHKSAYVFAVMLAHILDCAQSFLNLGLPFKLQIAACGYIIMTETLSIVENIAEINPELRNTALLELFKSNHPETKEEGHE